MHRRTITWPATRPAQRRPIRRQGPHSRPQPDHPVPDPGLRRRGHRPQPRTAWPPTASAPDTAAQLLVTARGDLELLRIAAPFAACPGPHGRQFPIRDHVTRHCRRPNCAPPAESWTEAAVARTVRTSPRVSVIRWRLRPWTFSPASMPWLSSTTLLEVLTLCASTTTADGSAASRCHVPDNERYGLQSQEHPKTPTTWIDRSCIRWSNSI